MLTYICDNGHTTDLDPSYDVIPCPTCGGELRSEEYRDVTSYLQWWSSEDPVGDYSWDKIVLLWRNARSPHTEGILGVERHAAYGDWMNRIHDTRDGRFISIMQAVAIPFDYPYPVSR